MPTDPLFLQISVETNWKETAAFAGHAETKAQRVCDILIQGRGQSYIIQSMEVSMFLLGVRPSICLLFLFYPCCRVPATTLFGRLGPPTTSP